MTPFVYFIETIPDHQVKIGVAIDTQRRMAHLQTANPLELRCRIILPGDELLERALHKRFAHCALRGEWFDGTDEDLARFLNHAWVFIIEHISHHGRPRLAELLADEGCLPELSLREVQQAIHGTRDRLVARIMQSAEESSGVRAPVLHSRAAVHVSPRPWSRRPPWYWQDAQR